MRGFLPTIVGSSSSVNPNFSVEAGSENVLAKKIFGTRFFDCCLQNLSRLREFLPDINVSGVTTDGETGDQHAFDQLVRILVHDVAVLESARFGFICIAD